jgi:hypothetical protein
MMELLGTRKRAFLCTLLWVCLFALSVMMTGCGGSKPATQAGLPPPATAGPVNSYVGGQGDSPSAQSTWSVTIDHSKTSYSYGPVSPTTVPVAGAFANLTGGFLILLNQNGYQNGLALEIPGEAIILRPGDSTTAAVFAVQQASCFPITGNVKFLFAFTPGLSGPNLPFSGRIYASTNSDGSLWQFNNQAEYIAPYVYEVSEGGIAPISTTFPGYPSGYSATCGVSAGSAVVSSTPTAYFQNGITYTLPTQSVISPAGFFFQKQDYSNVNPAAGWSDPTMSAWGVSEPSVPLAINGVATANYLGLFVEANLNTGAYRTRPVGFGNAPIAGTVMNGGTFPDEDPTQPVTQNMSVKFGTQDPLNNGVYYLATLTVPYDGGQSACGTPVPSPNGTLSCTYKAVAMVGTRNYQYASTLEQYTIILSATDESGNQKTLVLFQQ